MPSPPPQGCCRAATTHRPSSAHQGPLSALGCGGLAAVELSVHARTPPVAHRSPQKMLTGLFRAMAWQQPVLLVEALGGDGQGKGLACGCEEREDFSRGKEKKRKKKKRKKKSNPQGENENS
ncbi:hypothetical protein DL98DRAFT_532221 [Cadophora sp. DSE1049]|nr:hypothetical protein DL98DRAFT_532221 [Cadophora sp. DSE1049]